jgi:hypothetical protein
VECARTLGYTHVYHTYLSITSESGFPDLVLLRTPYIVVVECKTERGVVSPAQTDWLAAWQACGAVTLVARPEDWFSGRIEEALR